jgi:hypothetical protein
MNKKNDCVRQGREMITIAALAGAFGNCNFDPNTQ